MFQKFTTHNGNRKLGFKGDGDLIERAPETQLALRPVSKAYSQLRGGNGVPNSPSIVQHGSNGEMHRSAAWIMDVFERRFGMSVLRRVDTGTTSEGRRDKTSSGTFVARKKIASANCSSPEGASESITMGTCEDMVRRQEFFFLSVANAVSTFFALSSTISGFISCWLSAPCPQISKAHL